MRITIILITILTLSACNSQKGKDLELEVDKMSPISVDTELEQNESDEGSQEYQDFLDSGRAKAVESPEDLSLPGPVPE